MSALSIAYKDLQIFFKDRGAVAMLLLLPLLFILVFSGALTALSSQDEDTRLPLLVVDLDGGASAQAFLAGVEAAGGVEIQPFEDANEALTQLKTGQIFRFLTIPAGFSASIEAGEPVVLSLLSHANAELNETTAIQLVLEGVAQDMSLERQVLLSLQQMGDMLASAPPEAQQAFSVERMQAQARSQFMSAQEQPLVEVRQTVPAEGGEREEEPKLAQSTSTGFMVLFVFLAAQTTARSIYEEKKIGSFRRLLAAPLSKPALLAGKILPNIVLGIIQVLVILLFGSYGLRLMGLEPIQLGHSPLALALVCFLVVLCSTSFGLVIAALARTESQIGGISGFALWGMGAIGGSILPLFVLEKVLGPVSMVVPHYWANRALDDLMVRGLGFSDVALEMGVLAGFIALFIAIGLWRFDYNQ